MFTRPADVADDAVSAVVQDAWELTIRRIDYARLGSEATTGTRGRMRIAGLSLLMILSPVAVILVPRLLSG